MQRQAVEHIDGPLLILAGAGSGKTQTMTHRIAGMVRQGIDPHRILAVTFTNKAAGEMRERINALTPDTRGMWVMTFHAMCLRMLRFRSEALGYREGFVVYDETDRKALIKKLCKELEINVKDYPPALIGALISDAKENALGPEEYLEEHASDFRVKAVYKVYKAYAAELMKNNAMDFDDLLLNGYRLLSENEEAREYYSNRFKYIMVDEYQDTNYLQYRIISILAGKHGNLCVVGDDDQCIYEWRGANIQNILNFESDFPDAKVIRLEQNYRSHANILNLANSVIRNNKSRKKKKLWTEASDGEKITYRRLPDEKQEARYIGEQIEELHRKGYAFKDMAVLYRKNAQSRTFEEKFSFRGIPYRVLAGLRYYDRKEIKDVLSYLRLIENPYDDMSMLRIINVPKRGVGNKTLSSIIEYASNYRISIFEALLRDELRNALSAKTRMSVSSLTLMIEQIRAERDSLRLIDIYDGILRESGYIEALEAENTIESHGRIENIMEFRSVIEEFEAGLKDGDFEQMYEELEEERRALEGEAYVPKTPTALGMFLEKISLMADIDNRDEEEDAVVLMTLHSAKGLEFPVVFMPGMEDGIFPGPAAYDNPASLEEERRLCYVGITRAKEKLYLTGATYRMLYGRTDYTRESCFLNEMDRKYMDGDRTQAEKDAAGSGLHEDGGYLGGYSFSGRVHGSADGYSQRRRKPFDSLSRAKQDVSSGADDDFGIGERIRHPKFGEGMVIDQDAKTLSVMFDEVGLKKLGKGFVKLERV